MTVASFWLFFSSVISSNWAQPAQGLAQRRTHYPNSFMMNSSKEISPGQWYLRSQSILLLNVSVQNQTFGKTRDQYIFDRSAYFNSTTVCSSVSGSGSIGMMVLKTGGLGVEGESGRSFFISRWPLFL